MSEEQEAEKNAATIPIRTLKSHEEWGKTENSLSVSKCRQI
jgi:hypothetical protein